MLSALQISGGGYASVRGLNPSPIRKRRSRRQKCRTRPELSAVWPSEAGIKGGARSARSPSCLAFSQFFALSESFLPTSITSEAAAAAAYARGHRAPWPAAGPRRLTPRRTRTVARRVKRGAPLGRQDVLVHSKMDLSICYGVTNDSYKQI